MHKIPTLYHDCLVDDDCMVPAIINTLNIDATVLKRLSKLYESGMPIKKISDTLKIDQQMMIKLLRLLGYNTGVLAETWIVN
jgi:hypothetical protein